MDSSFTRTEYRTQRQASFPNPQQQQQVRGRSPMMTSPTTHDEATLRRHQESMSQQAFEQRQHLQQSFNTSQVRAPTSCPSLRTFLSSRDEFVLQGSEVFESSPSQMNQLHIDTMQRSFTSQRSPSSLR